MKFGKKEKIIIFPLAGLVALVIIMGLVHEPEQGVLISDTENTCQEGWIKYELESGILCSKTELSQRQIDEYGQVTP